MEHDYMVLAALRNLWPKEGHVIFPGEWAYRYQDLEDIKKIGAEIDPRPKVSVEENLDAVYKCTLYYYDRVLKATVDVLNTYHGIEESKEYWELVLGQWLCIFTRTYFAVYWRFVEAIKRHPDVYITVCEEETLKKEKENILSKIISSDGTVLSSKADPTIRTNFKKYVQLSQVAIRLNNLYGFTIQEDKALYEFEKVHCLSSGYALKKNSLIKNSIRNILYTWVIARGNFWSEFGLKDFIKCYGRYVPGYPDYINSYVMCSQYSSIERQKMKAHIEQADEFETVLLDILVEELPIYVVEDYKSIVSCARANAHRPPKFVNLSLLGEGHQLVFMAEWKKRGTQFARVEHSIAGGMVKHVDCQEKGVDYYYLWQKGLNSGKFRAMPSFKSHNGISQESECSDILWCSSDTATDTIFHMGMLAQWIDPKEYMPTFVETLREDVRERLVYRDRDTGGWGVISYYKDRYPWLHIDDQLTPGIVDSKWDTFAERCRNSRLVVCEHSSTGVVGETISINKPLIIVDPEVYERKKYYREGVFQFLAEMERIGILYRDPIEAARFINEKYDTINEWWNDKLRQDYVKRFIDYFMYTENDKNKWIKKELNEIKRKHSCY